MRTVPSVSISFGLAPPPPQKKNNNKKQNCMRKFVPTHLPYLLEMTQRRLLISHGTAVEGGDNSSYAGSEAREVFINTSSDISGVNK